jgi:hypothetical protein
MFFKKPNVLESLKNSEVADILKAAGLQVFGLRWAVGNGHNYVTLDEALQAQALEVTEIDEGGRVPTVKLTNKSEQMVFLMAGEELVAANRTGCSMPA